MGALTDGEREIMQESNNDAAAHWPALTDKEREILADAYQAILTALDESGEGASISRETLLVALMESLMQPNTAMQNRLTEQDLQEMDEEYETAMAEERAWYHDNLVRRER